MVAEHYFFIVEERIILMHELFTDNLSINNLIVIRPSLIAVSILLLLSSVIFLILLIRSFDLLFHERQTNPGGHLIGFFFAFLLSVIGFLFAYFGPVWF